jgi:subtilisin family serine protease
MNAHRSGMIFLSSALVLMVHLSYAQVNRYAVYFKDKNGTPFSINQPTQFLSTASINRRVARKASVTETDLPVNPSYVQSVKSLSSKLLFKSRWFNCVIIESDPTQLTAISQLPSVLKTEYLGPGPVPTVAEQQEQWSEKRTMTAEQVQQIQTQLSMLGLDDMHADGLKGEGITVAVTDSGFPGINVSDAFVLSLGTRIKDSYNFAFGRKDVFGYDEHGTDVLTVIGGEGNNFSGSAPKAEFMLYVTEFVPSEYRIEEYNWLLAAERADSAGADVINVSLGYTTFDDPTMDYTYADMNGNTTVISRAAKIASTKGMLVVASAGNEGGSFWQFISAPADAADVLAAGAVDASGLRAGFSSRGPTADGRIKPDLMAQGVGTVIQNQNGNLSTANGTSFSAPILTGFAAGLMQAFPEATIPEILEKLRSAGSMFTQPNNLMGYGIPDYNRLKPGEVTGIEEKNLVRVFPNPVTGSTLYIRFPSAETQDLHLEITELQGRKIPIVFQSVGGSEHIFSADVHHLTVGMYFLKIGEQAVKFIVK